ncbi:MAG: hypothetical protein J5J00_10855 [Deltaproteobacteria bacterium]|nr:hypothetical protein [Deltaproteobacteria bacterium]
MKRLVFSAGLWPLILLSPVLAQTPAASPYYTAAPSYTVTASPYYSSTPYATVSPAYSLTPNPVPSLEGAVSRSTLFPCLTDLSSFSSDIASSFTMETLEGCHKKTGISLSQPVSSALNILSRLNADELARELEPLLEGGSLQQATPSSFESTTAPTPLPSPTAVIMGSVQLPQPLVSAPDTLIPRLRRSGKKIPPYDLEKPWVCRHIAGYMETMNKDLTYFGFRCVDIKKLPGIPFLIGLKSQVQKAIEASKRNDPEALMKLGVVSHAINDYHSKEGISLIEPQAFMEGGDPEQAEYWGEYLDLDGDGQIEPIEKKRISPFKIRVCWSYSYNSFKESQEAGHEPEGESCVPE